MRLRISFLLLFFVCLGSCGRHPDYSAAPFFSEAEFSKIEVGMSEDSVRSLLGYPVSRFGPTESPSSTITWNYTVPASSESPLRFQMFSVKFGLDGRVLSKLDCEGSWEPHEGVPKTIEAIQKCRRTIGDVVLTGFEGSIGTLRESDQGLFVILLDEDCRAGTCQVNAGPQWFREMTPVLLKKGIIAGIKHVYIGGQPDKYRQLVTALVPDASSECYLNTEPALGLTVLDMDSRMLLYQAGTLWSVPAADGYPNAMSGADDQKWLIHRLGVGPIIIERVFS